jgi:ribose 1,5-bisphosphate isomerase
MDKFSKTLADIRSLKIQGAENVARSAVVAFRSYALELKTKSRAEFLRKIRQAKDKIFFTRPTEPLMRNSINFIMKNSRSGSVDEMKRKIKKSSKDVLDHFDFAQEKIADIGSKLIRNGTVVCTYCHSSTVVSVLKKAKSQGKKFKVNVTETRPLYQGRITAKDLSKAKIPVDLCVDSAECFELKESSIVLIGADAITKKHIYNKIGTESFLVMAKKYKIPVYVCTDSWKFDPEHMHEKIEFRKTEEVWKKPPKGVKIENPAFDEIEPELIKAIVSELGVLSFKEFLRKKHSKKLK